MAAPGGATKQLRCYGVAGGAWPGGGGGAAAEERGGARSERTVTSGGGGGGRRRKARRFRVRDGSRVRRRRVGGGPDGAGAPVRGAAPGGVGVAALPVRVRLGTGEEPLQERRRPRGGPAPRADAEGDEGGAAGLHLLPGAGELPPQGVRAGAGPRGAAAGGRTPQLAGAAAAAPHPAAHAPRWAAGRGHRGGRGAGRGRAAGPRHLPRPPLTSPRPRPRHRRPPLPASPPPSPPPRPCLGPAVMTR